MTLNDQDSIVKTVKKLGGYFADPDEIQAGIEQLKNGLGEGIDTTKPAQIAIWLDGPIPVPSTSFRIPVKSYDSLVESIDESSPLSPGDGGSIKQVGDYAVILKAIGPVSNRVKAEEEKWTPDAIEQLRNKAFVGQVEMTLNPQVRAMAIQGLNSSKKMMDETFSNLENLPQEAREASGMPFEPTALAELMGIYFETIIAIVEQTESMEFALGSDDQDILVDYDWKPMPNTLAAELCKTSDKNLTSLMKYLPEGKGGYFGSNFDLPEGILDGFTDFFSVSMKIQGVPQTAEETKSMVDFMKHFMKHSAVGYLEFADGMEFGGVYDFSNPTKKSLDIFMDYYKSGFAGMIGDKKMFKSISFDETSKAVDGKKFDIQKVKISLNEESPILQMPGQLDMMKSLYGGLDLNYEMSANDSLVFYSMNSDVSDLLAVKEDHFGTPLDKDVIFWMKMDPWSFIVKIFETNPMLKGLVAGKNFGPVGMEMQTTGGDSISSKMKISQGLLKNIASMKPVRPE